MDSFAPSDLHIQSNAFRLMTLERKFKKMFYHWVEWTKMRKERYNKLESLMKNVAKKVLSQTMRKIFQMWHRFSSLKVHLHNNDFDCITERTKDSRKRR